MQYKRQQELNSSFLHGLILYTFFRLINIKQLDELMAVKKKLDFVNVYIVKGLSSFSEILDLSYYYYT